MKTSSTSASALTAASECYYRSCQWNGRASWDPTAAQITDWFPGIQHANNRTCPTSSLQIYFMLQVLTAKYWEKNFSPGPAEPVRLVRPWPDQLFGKNIKFLFLLGIFQGLRTSETFTRRLLSRWNMPRMRWRPGLRPIPRWGSSRHSPRPPSRLGRGTPPPQEPHGPNPFGASFLAYIHLYF